MVLGRKRLQPLRGHWAVSAVGVGCHAREEMLLACGGYRLGLQLNILKCKGQPPAAQSYPARDVNRAEVGKPYVKINNYFFFSMRGGDGST